LAIDCEASVWAIFIELQTTNDLIKPKPSQAELQIQIQPQIQGQPASWRGLPGQNRSQNGAEPKDPGTKDRSRAPDCDCKKQRHERTNVRLQTSRQVESRHPGDPGDLADTADPGEMAQNLKRLSMILYHVLSTLQLR